ncbi:MAG: tyrosine-type recombinase/integrase, partial [Actinomycetota bacterium]|nr:tyrosine-type recombinase/integrase [Actinomycetota bacterium]
MRHAGTGPHAERLRALIVIMWRAGLRIGETLALAESDLDVERGSVLVRHGKGDKRREVGMDDWGWQQLSSLAERYLANRTDGLRPSSGEDLLVATI